MKQVTLFIDGREIKVDQDARLLWAALDNGIYIPNLCALREREQPHASCRLCFVEVEGQSRPVPSCTVTVAEGMRVTTRSPRVDHLVKTAFQLLLSDHRLDCYHCPANGTCELQKIARHRGLKLKSRKNLPFLKREGYVDESTGVFGFDSTRCVLCGRCVWIDRNIARAGALGFAHRGMERCITSFEQGNLAGSPCTRCGLCVKACPVGALYFLEKGDAASS